jgi:sortase A
MSPEPATLLVIVDDAEQAQPALVAERGQWSQAVAGPAPAEDRAKITRRPLKKADMLAILGRGLTTLGILIVAFTVFVVALSWLSARRDQRDLIQRFRNEAANSLAPVGGTIKEGSPVAVLDVPRLHLHLAVVEGTTSADLSRGPGHLRASPLPGQQGNVVIAGRRLAYGGPFLHLDRLRAGDKLVALTGQGQATYTVQGIPRRVGPGAPDVLGASNNNQMTLVTSGPVLLASQRLIVVARLDGAPRGSPPGRPTAVRPEDDALRGQGSAALPLLVWAELLLMAVIGATWLKRHWSGANVWLMATPIVAALLWLVFTYLTRLLPATV